MMEAAKQKIAPQQVGDSANLRKIAYLGKQQRYTRSTSSSNSCLLAAILKRKPSHIASIIDSSGNNQNEMLSEDVYKIMYHAYGPLVEKPVLLAMKLASSETTETTKDNEPTRLDVLHCLATHFDDLIKEAREHGKPIPDLNEILEYGRDFETAIPLHTFILGLPEHRKEEAADILNAKIAANA